MTLAPIALFVYAGANAADKLVDVYESAKALYKEFKQKTPHNTYWMRVGRKASEVVYNLANFGFKCLLAAAAFIAVSNPLGLVIEAALITTAATVVSGIAGGSLWFKNKLTEMIKGEEKRALAKQLKKLKKEKAKNELEAQRKPKPEQERGLLPRYEAMYTTTQREKVERYKPGTNTRKRYSYLQESSGL